MTVTINGTTGISTPADTIAGGNLTFTGTGNRITGDYSNATLANRVAFQTSTTNSFSTVTVIPNGTSTAAGFTAVNNSDPTNASLLALNSLSTEARILATTSGSGTFLPMTFWTNAAERLRITTAGNVGIGTTTPFGLLSAAGSNGILTLANGNTADGTKISSFVAAGNANGYLAFEGYSAEYGRFDSSGNFGIGTSSPGSYGKFAVNSGASSQNVVFLNSYSQIQHNLGGAGIGGSYSQWYADNTPSFVAAIGTNVPGQAAASGMVFSTYTGSWSERMRIDSNGRIQINTTTNKYSSTLTIVKGGNSYNITSSVTSTASSGHVVFENNNADAVGTIFTSGSSTQYNTSSDYRLKENIQPMQNALSTVAQLNPVTYNWKVDGSEGQGFIAHELQAVVPDCVTGEKDAVDENGKPVYQGIDTSFLVAILCKSIQELKAEIDQLKGAK